MQDFLLLYGSSIFFEEKLHFTTKLTKIIKKLEVGMTYVFNILLKYVIRDISGQT